MEAIDGGWPDPHRRANPGLVDSLKVEVWLGTENDRLGGCAQTDRDPLVGTLKDIEVSDRDLGQPATTALSGFRPHVERSAARWWAA
jgi:hypothetical protein